MENLWVSYKLIHLLILFLASEFHFQWLVVHLVFHSLKLFEITVSVKRVQILTEGRVNKLVLILEEKQIKSKSST